MLKSSSLCLYSLNLGTFWLKIEQFWPFEEIPNFAEMILGWSSSKIVSGISELRPIWPPQPPKDHSDKVWLKLA
jgi:hypothetical protein